MDLAEMKKLFAYEIGEDTEILAAFFSPTKEWWALMVTGENMQSTADQPIIRVYLLKRSGLNWELEEELQAFAFCNVKSALKFTEDLPHMSAFDLMLLMNGHADEIDQPMFS